MPWPCQPAAPRKRLRFQGFGTTLPACMLWLWYAAPLAIAIVFLINARWPDRRRLREITRFKNAFRPNPEANDQGVLLEASSLPGDFSRMIEKTGSGKRDAVFELFPKLAYLVITSADEATSSDRQSVVAKLAKAGPSFCARPLPLEEGRRVANSGVQFKKDPEFMDLYLVEGADSKAIVKWLHRTLRDALCELPDVWLCVEGRTMTLTLYGKADADALQDLVEVADEIFAEVGAEGAPALLAEHEDDEAEEEDGEDEGEDGEDEDLEPKEARKAQASAAR